MNKLIRSLFFLIPCMFLVATEYDADYLDYLDDQASLETERPASSGDWIDLNDFAQDFVLETKKIEIPGYPLAYNPSITRFRDSLLMSFRVRDAHGRSTMQIGLVWLDDDFQVASVPQILEIKDEYPCKYQDPRLLTLNGDLFAVYSNAPEKGGGNREVRRVFAVKIDFDGTHFTAGMPEYYSRFEGENRARSEKNWVPFDYQGNLLLAYSISPHRILQPQMGTGQCDTIAFTTGNIEWDWGHLRGGTPALAIGDEYLAFFHSSNYLTSVQSEGKNITHYYMGAYTFKANAPFDVTRLSPTPIVHESFYNGPAHHTWKPMRTVFPCGLVFDDRYIWVAYGKQDHEVWVVKFDKAGLLNSLVPVSSLEK